MLSHSAVLFSLTLSLSLSFSLTISSQLLAEIEQTDVEQNQQEEKLPLSNRLQGKVPVGALVPLTGLTGFFAFWVWMSVPGSKRVLLILT